MLRTIMTGLLVALVATPVAAQSRDVREAREDVREERRDLRDAQRYGSPRDVREEARDVRQADRQLSREVQQDRRADRRYRTNRYVPPANYAYRDWRIGYRLPTAYYGSRYVIGRPQAYGLVPVPREYRWVRVARDALLIDMRGRVIGIRRGLFY